MHLLYVDDSGSVSSADERHFILGAVSVFERGLHHLSNDVDECVRAYDLGDPADIELHAVQMYHGKGSVWSGVRDRATREAYLQSAVSVLAQPRSAVRLFAVAVDKAGVSPRDPVELAFEELCNRFNLYLKRIKNRTGDDQRGLIVMDETKHEKPLQALARNFRSHGGKWGFFRHLTEVPLFVDSKATRLIQLADLVAWSTWRKFEHKDGKFFDSLIPRFDAEGGVIHGLYHARGISASECYCPACASRKARDQMRRTP